MKIQRFVINTTDKSLSFILEKNSSPMQSHQLSFEYLRISSPAKKNQSVISHQKQVKLLAIENVAKHGYRLIFDDNHSAIYSEDYLLKLINEQESRWSAYLSELRDSGHSREAMIEIKQV
tara:strand:+ start:2537 stop:2896 length:360 start_codon:yes stop_codon:yes gene_type:complete